MARSLPLPASAPTPLLLLLPILLLVVDAAPVRAQQQGQQGPPTITVEITFDQATSQVGVRPDPIRVTRPGTRIQWVSGVGSWQVRVVRGNRAFGGNNDRDRTFRGTPGQPGGAVVPAAASEGTYKYVVTLRVQGQQLVLDPEIIIAF